MLRDFLWFLHAKQSYDMQKSNGLPGFLALIGVFVLMFKWDDWFAPIFFGLRLNQLPALLNADHGDFYAMTFIHMLAWFFLFIILIGILIVLACVLFIPLFLLIAIVWMILSYIVTSYLDLIKGLFKKRTITSNPLSVRRTRFNKRSQW